MRRFIVHLIVSIGLAGSLLSVVAPAPVNAQAAGLNDPAPGPCNDGNLLGISSWDKYLICDANNNDAIYDFVFPQDIWLVVLAVFEILTRLAVFLAVGVIIFAGFKFMIAQGNPEKISEAKTIIQDAIIGLAIAILATTIINFVAGSLI